MQPVDDLPQAHLHTADRGLIDAFEPATMYLATKSSNMCGGAPQRRQAEL